MRAVKKHGQEGSFSFSEEAEEKMRQREKFMALVYRGSRQ